MSPACGASRGLVFLAIMLAGSVAQGQSAPPALDLGRILSSDSEGRTRAAMIVPGIRSNHDLVDPRLKDARKRMYQGGRVSRGELQALADAGDGNAALFLISRLEEAGTDVSASGLAHYYGVAAATGRVAGLVGLLRVLRESDTTTFGETRLAVLRDIIVAYANAGNSIAAAALLDFHARRAPFGPMPEVVKGLARDGNPIVALHEANRLMQANWNDPDELERARGYLETASGSGSVRASVFATTMISVIDRRTAELVSLTAEEGDEQ